jgi:hypothetical protein
MVARASAIRTILFVLFGFISVSEARPVLCSVDSLARPKSGPGGQVQLTCNGVRGNVGLDQYPSSLIVGVRGENDQVREFTLNGPPSSFTTKDFLRIESNDWVRSELQRQGVDSSQVFVRSASFAEAPPQFRDYDLTQHIQESGAIGTLNRPTNSSSPADQVVVQTCIMQNRDKLFCRRMGCFPTKESLETHCRNLANSTTAPNQPTTSPPVNVAAELFAASEGRVNSCLSSAKVACGSPSSVTVVDQRVFTCLYNHTVRNNPALFPNIVGSQCSVEIGALIRERDNEIRRFGSSIHQIVTENSTRIASSCESATSCSSAEPGYDRHRCLFSLSTRLTRNGAPGYDGTPCDRLIRDLANRNRQAPAVSGAVAQGSISH